MGARCLKSLKALTLIFILSGCSSGIKKVDIPENADPASEVRRFESDVSLAYENNVDLFADKDMSKANNHLKEAREELKEGDEPQDVLEEISYGRAYLNRAQAEADKKMNPDSGIIKARTAAIEADVRQNSRLRQTLNRVDKDLRKETKSFEKAIPADRLAMYQRAYLNLELEAIRARHLGVARAQIQSAEEDRAAKRAPKTYRRALLDLKEAENEIMANRHAPARFESAVEESNASALMLVEVMRTIRNSKSNIGEDVAIRLVEQNRRIAGLEGSLDETKTELKGTEDELEGANVSLQNQSSILATQSVALSEAEKQIQMQKALDEARGKFSRDEAEVYQQGDKLLIRLKKMNYTSGQSELPKQSEELLSKVKEVALDLNPSQIVVEGHTDSVGGAQLNERISNRRAEAVARFFESDDALQAQIESVGHGYEKPIAPNKTREGRAMNRRVDIIITPGAVEGSTATE